MIKLKRFCAILGAATFGTALATPVLANKVPSKIRSVLKSARPVIQAEQKLEQACNFVPDLSFGKGPKVPKIVSIYQSATEEWNSVQRICGGAVVSKCMYNAVGKDIKDPEKVSKNPLPYIKQTVSCVDKTSSNILRKRAKINKLAKQGTTDAAKYAAEETKNAAKTVGKTVTNTTKKAGKSMKKAGKKAKKFFKR